MALLKKKKTEEKAEATAKTAKNESTAVSNASRAFTVLIRPLLTEKTTKLEATGVYSFEVAGNATKVDVKNAVKDVYGVAPKRVRMLNMEGKRLRFKNRKGSRKHWKKAMVTMPEGVNIDIHAGV